MNFEQWRATREQLVADHADLLRLDCMNPFRAMDHLVHSEQAQANNCEFQLPKSQSDYLEALLDLWSEATGVGRSDKAILPTLGIRSFLKLFFQNYRAEEKKVLLPSDVFPTYRTIAESQGWTVNEYEILPSPNWSQTVYEHGSPNVAVLPVPLTPLGRYLQKDEISFWKGWLGANDQRILILDTVYAYQPEQVLRVSEQLGERCILAWSVSKSWLQRCVFGFAQVHESIRSQFINGRFPSIELNVDEIKRQLQLMHHLQVQAEMPSLQNNRFSLQWKKLSPRIKTIAPNWSAPETGYFAVISMGHKELWESHRVLGVPATVFGSQRNELTVISCLYDIKFEDQGS